MPRRLGVNLPPLHPTVLHWARGLATPCFGRLLVLCPGRQLFLDIRHDPLRGLYHFEVQIIETVRDITDRHLEILEVLDRAVFRDPEDAIVPGIDDVGHLDHTGDGVTGRGPVPEYERVLPQQRDPSVVQGIAGDHRQAGAVLHQQADATRGVTRHVSDAHALQYLVTLGDLDQLLAFEDGPGPCRRRPVVAVRLEGISALVRVDHDRGVVEYVDVLDVVPVRVREHDSVDVFRSESPLGQGVP